MEQKIIRSNSIEEINKKMSELIQDGWEPIGSHQAVARHHQLRYAGMQHKDTMIEIEYSQTMRKI